MILLKDTFHSFANGLVGIYRDGREARREEASACATIDPKNSKWRMCPRGRRRRRRQRATTSLPTMTPTWRRLRRGREAYGKIRW